MNVTAKPPADRGKFVWIGVIVLVVILGLVAVVLSKDSNKDEGKDTNSQDAGVSVAPVAVTGQPLATFAEGDDPSVGKVIPALEGTTLDGKAITIGPDGKAKVMIFVAHWCPHCRAEVPRIVEHLKDTPLPDDVELATVSTSVQPDRGNYPPTVWLDDENWPTPVLADSKANDAATAFGLSVFPYFVVVDADGKVVQRTSGEITMDRFDALVDAASSGKPAN